jgi:hypothetical protein
MRSLFIVGQICADPLRHYHDECAVIYVHPISSTEQFIRRIANKWTIGVPVARPATPSGRGPIVVRYMHRSVSLQESVYANRTAKSFFIIKRGPV